MRFGRPFQLAALLGVAGIVATTVTRPARSDGPGVAAGFVGAAACADCHDDAHRRWASSVHATTFLPAVAADLPAEASKGGVLAHPPGSTTFRPRDGRFLAETLGPDGKPHEYEVTHVVGRRRIRMFLTTLDDGRLQVLPFMREEPGGPAFDYTHLMFGAPGGADDPNRPPAIAPGDASFWTGPERNFDAKCLRCHVSGPVPRGTASGVAKSSWRALGVDCEACHGAAAGHVAFQTGTDPDITKDPFAARRSFTREQTLGVCTVCHMEAEVVRPGFRPGDDVWEHVDPILLDDPEQIDASGRPLELVYAGIPFSVSRCAIAGRLTCTSCHEPHGGPHRSMMRWEPSSDAQCTSCHADVAKAGRTHTHHDPKGTGGRCVACHMPLLEIERGHGVVSDHTIGVPRLDEPGDRVAKDACTWCHTGSRGAPPGAPALTPDALRKGYAAAWPHAKPSAPWVRAIAAARTGKPGADALLATAAKDAHTPPLAAATAAFLLGEFPATGRDALLALAGAEDSLVRRNAVRALASLEGPEADAALLRALADPSPAVRGVAARAALEGWERVQANRPLLDAAIPVLRAEAAQVPDDDRRWFRLGAALELAGDAKGALAAYERELLLDPSAANVRKRVEQLRKRP